MKGLDRISDAALLAEVGEIFTDEDAASRVVVRVAPMEQDRAAVRNVLDDPDILVFCAGVFEGGVGSGRDARISFFVVAPLLFERHTDCFAIKRQNTECSIFIAFDAVNNDLHLATLYDQIIRTDIGVKGSV